MAQYTITLDDPLKVAGITAARAQYNAGLQLDKGQAVEDHPDYLATDAAYVQYVMDRAAESYKSLATLTVTIDDPAVVAKIVAEREALNAGKPEEERVSDADLLKQKLAAAVAVAEIPVEAVKG